MDTKLNRIVRRLRQSLTQAARTQTLGRDRAGQPSRKLALERLEDRITPTTAIDFTNHILSLNVGANNETATLSVSGTNLSISSSDAGGTTATAAAQALGFAAMTNMNVANVGSIAAANDVRQIVITGAGGTQTVVFGGGTFTATSATDGTIENINFTAATTFSKISASAPNANLDLVANTGYTIGANITTLNGGNVSLTDTAATGLTVSNTINAGTGNVTLAANDMAITAGITGQNVLLQPVATNRAVTLGGTAAGTLSLTDAELDQVTTASTGVLRIHAGSTSGNIAVAGAVTQPVNGYQTLSLQTQNLISGAGSISVTNLALTAGTGINLSTAVQNLAFDNATGAVAISNTGSLQIAAVDQLSASQNLGTTTDLTASSPVTFAVDTTSQGTLTATATEANGPGDDVTVLSGVTVTSTTGDIVFQAGDSVVLQSGSAIQASAGNVTLTSRFNDTDGIGTLTLNGSITVAANQTVNLTAAGDVSIGTITAMGGTVNVTSTGGAIIDGNDPPTGTNNITANTVNLSAATGIGSGASANAPIEITASTLTVTNSTSGDIQVANESGNISVSGSNTGGGAINLTALGGGTLTVGAGNLNSHNGPITLSADDMVITGTVVAGTGIATLQQADTTARTISLGTNTAGTLGLTSGELNQVTTSRLIVGRTDNAGPVQVTGNVIGTNFTTLLVRSGGIITPNGGSIRVANLALQAVTGIGTAITPISVIAPTAAGINLAFTTTTGPVNITSTGRMNIANVAGVQPVTNTATSTQLTAASPVIFTVDTSSAGDLTATATESAAVNTDNVVVNANITVTSTGGSVSFQAGDRIILNGGSTVSAPTGNVTLASGVADADGDGSQTLNGTVAADGAAGTVTIDLGATGAATEAAGGTITANSLLLLGTGATGSFSLCMSPTNNVAVIAASAAASIEYQDADGLSVGTVGMVNGITATAGDVSLRTLDTGDLTIDQDITANAGTVRLTAGQDVTETTGAISANALGVIAGRDALLSNANNAPIVAISAGGNVVLNEAAPFAFGTVTATACFAGAANLIPGPGDDITICQQAGDLVLNAPLSTTGTIRLNAVAGGISQAGGAIITSTDLGILAAGNVNLDTQVNQVSGNLAALVTGAGNHFFFQDGTGVTVGTVTASDCFSQDVVGITTTDSPIVLCAPTITLNAAVNAGAADVLLSATTGGISQSAAGIVTAANLGVKSVGDVDLATAVNVVAGNVAAAVTGAGSHFFFQDGVGVTVATVTGLSCFGADVTGITTNNGTIVLCAPALALNAAVNAGTGDVLLNATTGGISQTAAGIITATNLGIVSATDVDLDTDVNQVSGNLAGTVTGAGNHFFFQDGAGVTVGTVTGQSCFGGDVTGITTNNGPIVVCAPTLAINAAVNAGTADVLLNATTDGVIQTATGIITAADLGVKAVGNVDLDGAVNQVSGMVAGTAGGHFFFQDGAGVTVGTVTGQSCFGADVTGIGGGPIVLCAPTITLNAAVNAGANDVLLDATTGGISQNAAGIITAADLGVKSVGNVDLDTDVNAVSGNVAAAVMGAGSHFFFQDGVGVTVATVTGLSCFGADVTGITTNNGTIVLCAPTLALNAAVNAGTGDVLLNGTTGNVTQNAAGIITAADLGVTAVGNVDLDVAVNQVSGMVAGTAGGHFFFQDGAGVTVGTVTGQSCFGADVTGIGGGPIVLCAPTITLNAAVNAGAADVLLSATTGGISQSAAGIVTAANLGVKSVGDVDLATAVNVVAGNVAAAVTGAGSHFFFQDGVGVTVATVTGLSCFGADVTGITTNNGTIVLCAPALALNAAVNAGTGDVLLNATTGGISQTAAGIITATNLGIVSATDVDLDTDVNQVSGNLAGTVTGAGNHFFFQDGAGVTVGTVTGQSCFGGDVTGITTNNGPIVVCAPTLAINAAVNAGTADVLLNATTDGVIQTATGIITAADLGVKAVGNVDLDGAVNQVSGMVAGTAGGHFFFQDGAGVTVGTVTGQSCFGADVTGIGGGPIVLCAPTITLNAAVNAGANDVLLDATTGGISQNAAGIITAADLGVKSVGNVDLDTDVNAVSGNVAAAVTGAGSHFFFQDGVGVTVATVTGLSCFGGDVTGITTNNGPIVVCAPTLGINAAVNAGTADVLLNATTGGMSQTAAGIITAADLGLKAAGNVDLHTAPNVISTNLAATITGAGNHLSFLNAHGLHIAGVTGVSCFGASIPTNMAITADGDITITVQDSTATGDDLTVNPTARVASAAGAVTLQAGDNLTLSPTSNTVAGGGTLTLAGDFGNVDPMSGTIININGDVTGAGMGILVTAGTNMNNTINIDSNGGTLTDNGTVANVHSAVTVTVPPPAPNSVGSSTLNLDDTEVSAATTLVITNTQLQGAGTYFNAGVNVTYSGLSDIVINDGSGADTARVLSDSARTTINGFGGNDVMTVGSNAVPTMSNLDGLTRPVILNVGTGSNSVGISDFTSATANSNVILTNSMICGFAGANDQVPISYSVASGGSLTLVLDGSNTSGDGFVIDNTNPLATTTINGNGGNDKFRVVSTQSTLTLNGGAGSDVFSLANSFHTQHSSLTINGGDNPPLTNQNIAMGADALSYFDYTTGVSVNLATSTATDLAGFTGIEYVEGGHAVDTLIGGNFFDILYGGPDDQLLPPSIPNGNGFLPAGPVLDILQGGTAGDAFVLNDCVELTSGRVQITFGTNPNLVVLDNNSCGTQVAGLVKGPQPGMPPPPVQPPNGIRPQLNLTSHLQTDCAALNQIMAASSAENRGPVAMDILGSNEHRSTLIAGYYQRFLGRAPEAAGLQAWLHSMAAGATQEQVIAAFIASDEYFQTHGNNNADFIRALYHDILGRTPAQTEVDTWLGVLPHVTRNAVAMGFLMSDEYRLGLIKGYYQQFLGRNAETAGLQFFLGQMRQGLTDEQVQALILQSDEYQARSTAKYGEPDVAFIMGLYHDVLGRAASVGEVQIWLEVLNRF